MTLVKHGLVLMAPSIDDQTAAVPDELERRYLPSVSEIAARFSRTRPGDAPIDLGIVTTPARPAIATER